MDFSERVLNEGNRKWWTLATVSLGLFMIMLDNTVVNVALPSIQRDSAQVSRSSSGSSPATRSRSRRACSPAASSPTCSAAGSCSPPGSIVFAGSSLACALAPTAGFLIGARAVQGVGAALMGPATLSIIAATFPPRQRGAAIGIWVGISASALAIGPLVGGLLTEHAGWSSIFYVNVPIGAAAVVATFLLVAESKDTSREQRLDLPGLLTSGVGLLALTYGLIEANSLGWTSGRIVATFAVAVVSLVAFVLLELRQRLPMLDLTLFRSGTFAGANTVVLLVTLAMFGVLFFLSLYMQNVLGYSAVQAGAAFLPMTLLVAVVAPAAGRISDRLGSRALMAGGMTLVGLQLVYFSTLGTDERYWALVPGMLLGGIGMPCVMTPASAAALSSVPVDRAGVGSAVLNSSRQVGGSIGIALMGAIMAHELAGRLDADAFTHGLSVSLRVAAAIAFAGALVAVTLIRSHAGEHREARRPHRLRSLEQEGGRLWRVAQEGRSGATPAIVGGAVLLALVPIFVTVLALAMLAGHFAGG